MSGKKMRAGRIQPIRKIDLFIIVPAALKNLLLCLLFLVHAHDRYAVNERDGSRCL